MGMLVTNPKERQQLKVKKELEIFSVMSDSSYVGFVYKFVFHIFTLGFLRSISNLILSESNSLPWSEENYI